MSRAWTVALIATIAAAASDIASSTSGLVHAFVCVIAISVAGVAAGAAIEKPVSRVADLPSVTLPLDRERAQLGRLWSVGL
jgi:hypothetical protein